MQEKWVVAAKRADFRAIAEKYGIDPVIARLIRNRDVTEDEAIRRYLYGTIDDLYDPSLMKDLDRAAHLLIQAVNEKKKIRIIGDYDIDGIMSSYILITALQRLGADADVRIPERIKDGYGLNENLVRQAAEDGIEWILTCDNGIAAAEQIALAGSLGLRTIVTDHHEIPFSEEDGVRQEILPPAEAVVDPHQSSCGYPFKNLCGAGVAYKLVWHMLELAKVPDRAELLQKLLAFAAIATVGDVMDLKDENRILVREGLKEIHRTENLGLNELILQSGLEREQVDVYHIGFVLGPCLNASGRLDTASRALAMLMAKDRGEAAQLAGDLVALNASRKDMTAREEEEAIALVENSPLKDDRVLVVYLPDCHESLAGIIAGRLKEHFFRPAFVLTRTEEGVKGSGRSIEAYSMYEELCKCRELFTKFGGHPMAAGLSLPEENVEEFRRQINACCSLTEEEMIPKITIDVPVPVSYIREDLIRQIDLLKPFGKGNSRPLFAERGMEVRYLKVLGRKRNVAKMMLVSQDGCRMDAVYFGDADSFAAYAGSRGSIDIVYYPGIDTWQGRNRLQVTISAYR